MVSLLGISVNGIYPLSVTPRKRIAAQHKLAELLKQHRLLAGLRQVDVAVRLQQPQSYVSKYESGERGLGLSEIQAICAALGVPLVKVVKQFEENER